MINPVLAALVISGIALTEATIALLVVLLRQPPPNDTPVEGIDGLDRTFAAGRDLPTAPLPRPGHGTVYTSRHRREGPSQWVANLGRRHTRRHRAADRHLP